MAELKSLYDEDTAAWSEDARMSDLKTLHDKDFLAWSKQQAEALRAAAQIGAKQLIDWENLAEEIEDLGRSQRSSVASHIMRIIQHLVKLDHSPAVEPRRGWCKTIRLARLQVEKRLEDNPSLKPELGRIVDEETRRGIESAIADFEEHGELDELDANVLRRAPLRRGTGLGGLVPGGAAGLAG